MRAQKMQGNWLNDNALPGGCLHWEGRFNYHNTLLSTKCTKQLDFYKNKLCAESIILGCAEIPILIKQENSPMIVFDSTAIHA
jgi:aspartate/glutamate racemase